MTPTRRPCCRPSTAHDWQPLYRDYLSCSKCGRLASRQRGGSLGWRGRVRLYNWPEIEEMIRPKAPQPKD